MGKAHRHQSLGAKFEILKDRIAIIVNHKKITVFNVFLTNMLENRMFSILFHMARPRPGPEGPDWHSQSWELQCGSVALNGQLNLMAGNAQLNLAVDMPCHVVQRRGGTVKGGS